ncbi:MAG TPA: magnesium transporter [Tepidisphaeraceae bacterium]|jgi:magnesium transporter|nr:magnesium transporter [Tepidisphaeraceae bacterium]
MSDRSHDSSSSQFDDSARAEAHEIPPDEAVAQQIEEIHAVDGANVLENLPYGQAADVAEYLDPQTAGRIFAEMDPEAAAHVVDDMEAPEASMVLASMDPDDRVDVLEHVSDAVHDAIVKEMEPEERAEVQLLEQYPPDTAGGIMTTEVTSLEENLTVEQAINEIRRLNEEYEQLFYCYVIDSRRHLIGVLSMRDLILSKPDIRIRKIMRPSVVRVPVTMDQEKVAEVMRRSKYLAMPVVDDYNRLVGLITVDDIVDVIQEEATEDVQKMFGAGAEERLSSPWFYSFRKRIGWLEVNLATAFLAAWVISWFQDTIVALPMLAAYQSVVSGMGGNAGAQALAVAIRGMAVGEGGKGVMLRALYREALVGLVAGTIIGVTTGLCAGIGLFHDPDHFVNTWVLAGVITAALTVNHLLACTTGVLIPFAMRRLGFDPAQSATVWATTVTDCCGFFATLGFAKICMHWLVHP